MAQSEMYAGQAFSPQTQLNGAITSTDTTITVLDGAKLPAAPNYLVFGTYGDPVLETVLYNVKTGNVLSGVIRAVEGTAQAWANGTPVARFFTAKDHNTFIDNIKDIVASLVNAIKGVKVDNVLLTPDANKVVNVDLSGKQNKITTTGILKGDGAGGTSAAVVNTDFAAAAHAARHATGGGDAITPANIGAEASGTAASQVSTHDGNSLAHSTQFGNKQNKITANGILKGDGAGGITAAVSGTDYVPPATLSNYAARAGATMTGALIAGGTLDNATTQVRNIHAGLTDMTAGTSSLTTGAIYLVYE